MTILLWATLPVLFLLASFGPLLPVLGERFAHLDVREVFAHGGVVILFAGLASLPFVARRTRSIAASLGLVTAAGVVVHLSSGLVGAHLLLLLALAVVSLYQDWLPMAVAMFLALAYYLGVGFLPGNGSFTVPVGVSDPRSWAFVHVLFILGITTVEMFRWRANARMRAFTDHVVGAAGEGLVGIDDTGHISFVNPAAEALLGKKERLLGQPADRVFAACLPPLVTRDAQIASLQDGGTYQGRGRAIVDPDGAMRYVDWASVPLIENHVAVGAVVRLRDVTERQIAEARLLEHELQLSAAQRIARLGTFEWAPIADVFRASEEMRRLAERANGGVAVRLECLDDLLELVHRDDREAVHQAFMGARRAGDIAEIRCRFGIEASVRHCTLRARLEEGQEGPVPLRLVRGTCHDITEQVEGEALRQRALVKDQEIALLREQDRFKNQFINAVAHELNTPLTPVRLQLHLLKRDPERRLDERQRRAVSMLDRNMKRFSSLVEDLLDAARIQGGGLRMDVADVALDGVVDEAVDHFEGVMLEKDLAVELDVAPGVWVSGDRDRLIQVLYNLLSNACKFTPEGGLVQVRVRATDDEAVVSVSDNGIGIDPQDQVRLFQPFSRLEDPMRTMEPGTGLGLYLAQGIIDLHGGRMWCESEGLGRGATFALALPLRRDAIVRVDGPLVRVRPVPRGDDVRMGEAESTPLSIQASGAPGVRVTPRRGLKGPAEPAGP